MTIHAKFEAAHITLRFNIPKLYDSNIDGGKQGASMKWQSNDSRFLLPMTWYVVFMHSMLAASLFEQSRRYTERWCGRNNQYWLMWIPILEYGFREFLERALEQRAYGALRRRDVDPGA